MLRHFRGSFTIFKRHVSALYVTGDKASEHFAVLTPFLNYEERLQNYIEVEENVKRRKMKLNLDDFRNEYDLYKSFKERKKALANRRVEISKLMREAPNEGLKLQGIQVREDLRLLKENSYHLEDSFIHCYLDLPNYIHNVTPDNDKKVVYSFKEVRDKKQPNLSESLLDEFIEFYDSTCYFLKGEAAKFDLFLPMHVLDLHQDKGFMKFSNPDFSRSVIAEGAGIDSKKLFLLKEVDIENKLNLLHFTGNGSFVSFLPFITKLSTFPTLFPMKFICTGKQYDAENHFEHNDLYKVVQSTCCQSFVSTVDGSTFNDIMDEQIEIFKELFEMFGQHFRIYYYPAHELNKAESCKLGVEMFSPSQNKYIEVGNFSYYGDYVSKRLLFNYKIGKDLHFPHIYSGTVVNVMKLILLLIENTENFKCPNELT
ncbi:CLUMA_CG002227, isoform A [Clunio marinus]|uniref:CLUMA_CG002227, isoform A n=1 Tax=Clunio marinus TaxID=568069 RepID=A0A1J1HLM3_9DIPT|nr:CLUMA_CG002227, isoform A [Clunio marinus]